MEVRLNKFLAECGVASRRKSEEYITTGRVTVNGKLVTELATKVDEDTDVVMLDGEKVKAVKKSLLYPQQTERCSYYHRR